jgi:hypothetical protein
MNSEIDKKESAKIEGQIEDLLAILAHDEVSGSNKADCLKILLKLYSNETFVYPIIQRVLEIILEYRLKEENNISKIFDLFHMLALKEINNSFEEDQFEDTKLFKYLLRVINNPDLLAMGDYKTLDCVFDIQKKIILLKQKITKPFLNCFQEILFSESIHLEQKEYVVYLYADLLLGLERESDSLKDSLWGIKKIQYQILQQTSDGNRILIYALTFNLLRKLVYRILMKQSTPNSRKHFEPIFINFYQLMKNLIDFNDIETFKLVIEGLFASMKFQVLANLDLEEDYDTLYKPYVDNENPESQKFYSDLKRLLENFLITPQGLDELDELENRAKTLSKSGSKLINESYLKDFTTFINKLYFRHLLLETMLAIGAYALYKYNSIKNKDPEMASEFLEYINFYWNVYLQEEYPMINSQTPLAAHLIDKCNRNKPLDSFFSLILSNRDNYHDDYPPYPFINFTSTNFQSLTRSYNQFLILSLMKIFSGDSFDENNINNYKLETLQNLSANHLYSICKTRLAFLLAFVKSSVVISDPNLHDLCANYSRGDHVIQLFENIQQQIDKELNRRKEESPINQEKLLGFFEKLAESFSKPELKEQYIYQYLPKDFKEEECPSIAGDFILNNQKIERERFFDEWHVGYSGFEENLAEYIFRSITGLFYQRIIEAIKNTEEILLESDLAAGFGVKFTSEFNLVDRLNNFLNEQNLEKEDVRIFLSTGLQLSYIQKEALDKALQEAAFNYHYLQCPFEETIFVINLKSLPKLVHYKKPRTDLGLKVLESETYKDSNLFFTYIDYADSERAAELETLLEEPYEWLREKYTDKQEMRSFLKKHIFIRVFLQYDFKKFKEDLQQYVLENKIQGLKFYMSNYYDLINKR